MKISQSRVEPVYFTEFNTLSAVLTVIFPFPLRHCPHISSRTSPTSILFCKKDNLSHDVSSESDITPCNKIDKTLVVNKFHNVML